VLNTRKHYSKGYGLVQAALSSIHGQHVYSKHTVVPAKTKDRKVRQPTQSRSKRSYCIK
jgi:hypothetical protein